MGDSPSGAAGRFVIRSSAWTHCGPDCRERGLVACSGMRCARRLGTVMRMLREHDEQTTAPLTS
jgi:hypothetical protein